MPSDSIPRRREVIPIPLNGRVPVLFVLSDSSLATSKMAYNDLRSACQVQTHDPFFTLLNHLVPIVPVDSLSSLGDREFSVE